VLGHIDQCLEPAVQSVRSIASTWWVLSPLAAIRSATIPPRDAPPLVVPMSGAYADGVKTDRNLCAVPSRQVISRKAAEGRLIANCSPRRGDGSWSVAISLEGLPIFPRGLASRLFHRLPNRHRTLHTHHILQSQCIRIAKRPPWLLQALKARCHSFRRTGTIFG
jgi:hypothetical protein